MELDLTTVWQDVAGLASPVQLSFGICVWQGPQEKKTRVYEGLKISLTRESPGWSRKRIC